MDPSDPALLYLVLILPSLFALTLLAEGLHKILRKESGWVSLLFGLLFLFVIIYAYFNFLR